RRRGAPARADGGHRAGAGSPHARVVSAGGAHRTARVRGGAPPRRHPASARQRHRADAAALAARRRARSPGRRDGARDPRGHRGVIFLVTGTDTGVGKTYVACGLARAAVAAGLRVAVRKPAETGCASDASGRLVPQDALALRDAAAGANGGAHASVEPLDEVCALALAEPLAPAVAAQRAGQTLDVGALVAAYRRRAAEVDLLLVE